VRISTVEELLDLLDLLDHLTPDRADGTSRSASDHWSEVLRREGHPLNTDLPIPVSLCVTRRSTRSRARHGDQPDLVLGGMNIDPGRSGNNPEHESSADARADGRPLARFYRSYLTVCNAHEFTRLDEFVSDTVVINGVRSDLQTSATPVPPGRRSPARSWDTV